MEDEDAVSGGVRSVTEPDDAPGFRETQRINHASHKSNAAVRWRPSPVCTVFV